MCRILSSRFLFAGFIVSNSLRNPLQACPMAVSNLSLCNLPVTPFAEEEVVTEDEHDENEGDVNVASRHHGCATRFSERS